MEFSRQPEGPKPSSKVLLTCPLCLQYFDDPRQLPCSHTFCRRCLQKRYDQNQEGSSVRIGRMNCPKCKTVIGIPMAGVEAFPVDTKINRIKDLVINELAQDISKNIHSQSDSSSHSDSTNFTDSSEDDFAKRSNLSSQARSRFTSSDGFSESSGTTNSNYQGNPLYANMGKYAKYFVRDEEAPNSEVYTPHFKPTIRAERRRVGYSSSFQHRRRRVNIDPQKSFDDSADLVRQSRYGSSPHIGRGHSFNANSSSLHSDVFQNVPQSYENLTGSSHLGSKGGRGSVYETMRDHHSASSDIGSDEYGATSSMPSLSKSQRDYAPGNDPDLGHSGLRNIASEPKFNYSTQARGTDNTSGSNGRSWRSPLDEYNSSDQPKSRSVHFRDKFQNTVHEKPRPNLATHRENIVSSTTEPGRPSVITRVKEETDSGERWRTERPQSDYYSDRPKYMFTEEEPSKNKETSFEKKSDESSFSEKVERKLPKVPGDKDTFDLESEYQRPTPLGKESFTDWYQEIHSKKQDETFIRTQFDGNRRPDNLGSHGKFEGHVDTNKPDNVRKLEDIQKPNNFKTWSNFVQDSIPKFHKSASFTSSTWQEKSNRNGNSTWNQSADSPKPRGLFRRTINKSCNNINDRFEGSIKFEFKKKTKVKNHNGGVGNGYDNGWIDQNDSEHESEMEQRNAFNERILNMRMKKEAYDNIMSDFKNGNLSSEEYFDEKFYDMAGNEDKTTNVESNNRSAETDGMVFGKLEALPMDPEKSDNKPEKSVLNSQDESIKDTSDDVKRNSVLEEIGQNLKEMIDSMRAKYGAFDQVHEIVESDPVVMQPSCSDNIIPKWNFQKMEFCVPTSVAITSKGCTVVADYGNSCLEYFDADGNYEHKIEGVKPFCIVVNKLDQIIVGDRKGKAIRLFDEYGADVAQWEGGQFGWISGIALLQNGNVVVYDRDRCKVGIYSSGGEKITEFASYGMNDSQLCMADFLTVDAKNRIIVADSGNHCLKIFDTDGKFINKVACRGVDDGCLKWPKGVCVDSMDNIIVADSQNNRVSMFSPSGQFVEHLLTTTPSPYSVCFSSQANLLAITHYALTGFSQYDVYQCLK